MNSKKSLIALSLLSVLALSACSGSGGGGAPIDNPPALLSVSHNV